MLDKTSNSKRIAKNSMLLSMRLLITMCISLYTSRVVLNVLGVEDYGVYNVVGGFVVLFTALTDSLGRAYSRFTTVAIAHNDVKEQRAVFSANINILLLVAFVLILLCEIVGVWYFDFVANIPENRKEIVLPLFHISLITFFVNLCKTPSVTYVIAYEKSGIYALFGIVEAILKLVVVYLLSIATYDKLLSYAMLLLLVSVIICLSYTIYCRRQFQGFKYVMNVDWDLYRKLFGFTTWSFVGILAKTFNSQGLILIINRFLGVVVNAACGIVTQVEAFSRLFVTNIAVAINPQIVKSFTQGDISYARNLILFSSKCFCFVVLLYSIPIALEANILIKLWLGFVPEHTIPLLRLSFISTLFIMMGNPIEVGAQATGKIKRFQKITGLFLLLELPIAYFVLHLGFSVEVVYALTACVYAAVLVFQLTSIHQAFDISIFMYLKNVYAKVIFVAILSYILSSLTFLCFDEGLPRLLITCVESISITLVIIYTIGLDKNERSIINSIISVNRILKWRR